MSPEQIGLLVMKLQDDDVLASDMRKFINALMTDEEVRRNARLVSSLSGLPEETRRKHCSANVLMLLSASQLAPSAPPSEEGWRAAKPKFVQDFFTTTSGAWKDHMRPTETLSSMEFQRRVRSAGRKSSTPLPGQMLSSTLIGHVKVIEEFWGVVGLYV